MNLRHAGLDRIVVNRLGAQQHPVGPPPTRRPTVTVVVPCYNYGHLLPSCVASVLEQPGVDVDVIIVDDASPDGSVAVARALADADARVSLIADETNKGHIRTYNDGLEAATGDYTVLLSADDLLTPGSLERATSLMEAHPSVGFTYGHPVRFDGPTPPAARVVPSSWTIWPGRDWIEARCRAGTNCFHSPEVMIRTSIQATIGSYDPSLPHSADFAIGLRAASVADVGHVDGADQAYYRVHGANMHLTKYNFGQASGIMVPLEQRRRAFDSAFAGPAAGLAQATELHELARRTLASRALRTAGRAYLNGRETEVPVDALLDFAAATSPNICTSFEYRTLRAWAQKNACRRTYERSRIVAYEMSGKAREATRFARWKLVGV